MNNMDIIYREIVLASNIGINGNLFGGTLMSWMDKAATLYVSSLIKSQDVVTAKFGEINFIEKVKEKDLIRIYAGLNHIGNSSVKIDIKVCKVIYENYSERLVDVLTTDAIFVHIDSNGNSKKIPDFIKKVEKNLVD